jgi:translocation and assembly module TamB
MQDEAYIETPDIVTRGRRWSLWIFGTASVAVIALVGVAYWQRITIADRFVRDQIEKYGVQVSYKIKDVGIRTQRIEDLVIGDPKNPDLTAKAAEIDLSINFYGATLREVRATGVHLNGKYDGQKLSFGALDKFSDPARKEPFEIPDIALTLKDATLRLETPYGRIGAAINGRGLLRQRFSGNIAINAPSFLYKDCLLSNAEFDGQYIFYAKQPNLIGPLTAEKLLCKKSNLEVTGAVLESDVRLSQKLDRWIGDINFSAKNVQTKTLALSMPRGEIQFDGGRERTNFDARLNGGGYRGSALVVRNVELSATGRAEMTDSGVSISARGDAEITGSTLNKSFLAGVGGLAAKGRDTPVGPLLAQLVPAARDAAASFDADMRYDGNFGTDGKALLIVNGLSLRSRSGARLNQSGILQFKGSKAGFALASPVSFALSGGGLPTAKVALQQGRGNQWAGELALAEYSGGGASLALPKLNFAGSSGGLWNFDGRAMLTGPLQDGYVKGLNLPIDARWDGRNISLYQTCQTVAFDGIKYADFTLGKQSVRMCPNDSNSIFQSGGGSPRLSANIPDFVFNGSYAGQKVKAKSGNVRFNLDKGFTATNIDAEYGNSPIHVRAPTLQFNFGKGFTTKNVQVKIGQSKSQTVFNVANVQGRFDRGALFGTLDGANGQIANVPLILSNAEGNWSYRNGTLGMNGSLQVSDKEQVDRFLPLNVPDAAIILRNGLITAQGSLIEPSTQRKLSGVDIRHMLSSGSGGAVLAVDNLRFDKTLQPVMITPITKGVIADVIGTVNGTGYINWTPNSVKSNGKFSTESLDASAGFGPVEQLTTEIEFTDLLAFETGPGQLANIGSVNPGIRALAGKIRYQLLPGKKIGIEGGRWPFAGGELILEPTVLDFGVEAERRLTFRVEGMDAAIFLQQYEFDNMQVSGIFDGTLPMIFNQQGGRIDGGKLVSRSGGGELSYLGEISYKDMGVFANFAFQALRSIRYNELSIDINGDLGGEIITEVSFSGVQQGTGAKRNFITRQLANLPIQFNVRISAQFLQLIGSIRGIYDKEFAKERYVEDRIEKAIEASKKQTDENEQKDE